MKYTDYTQIEDIKFKYPDLMSEDAKNLIMWKFREIHNIKELIANANAAAADLGKKLKSLERDWQAVQPLIEVTYKEVEKEDIHNEVNIGFNFNSEINKNIH